MRGGASFEVRCVEKYEAHCSIAAHFCVKRGIPMSQDQKSALQEGRRAFRIRRSVSTGLDGSWIGKPTCRS